MKAAVKGYERIGRISWRKNGGEIVEELGEPA